MRVQAFVFIERLNRNSPPYAGTNNLPRQNARLRADHRATLHTDVIAEPDLPANHAIIFNRHAAADAGLCCNHHPLSNVAVMTDVDHIIQFCSFANACAPQRPAIDARVRAQFDVVFDNDRADLRKFVITHVAANVAEAVGADDYAGMKNDPITNRHSVFEKYVWMNHAIVADLDVVANLRASTDL